MAGAQWASLKWTGLWMESLMMGRSGNMKFYEEVEEFLLLEEEKNSSIRVF